MMSFFNKHFELPRGLPFGVVTHNETTGRTLEVQDER